MVTVAEEGEPSVQDCIMIMLTVNPNVPLTGPCSEATGLPRLPGLFAGFCRRGIRADHKRRHVHGFEIGPTDEVQIVKVVIVPARVRDA